MINSGQNKIRLLFQWGLRTDISRYVQLVNQAFFRMYPKSMIFQEDFFWWCGESLWNDPMLIWGAYQLEIEPVGVVFCYEKRARIKGEFLHLGYVGPVAVHPQYWRKGIAKTLLEKLIEVCQTRRMDALVLSTDPKYPAHFLYQRLGFRTYSIRRPRVKILDVSGIMRTLGLPTGKGLLRFIKIRKKYPLGNFSIKEYEPSERSEVYRLYQQSIASLDYADLPSQSLWDHLLESPKSTGLRTWVIKRNNSIAGSFTTFDLEVKIRKHFLPGALLFNLIIKPEIGGLFSEPILYAAEQLKSTGAKFILQMGFFDPALEAILKNCGFRRWLSPVQWSMYKPLRSGVDKIFNSIRTYREFLPLP